MFDEIDRRRPGKVAESSKDDGLVVVVRINKYIDLLRVAYCHGFPWHGGRRGFSDQLSTLVGVVDQAQGMDLRIVCRLAGADCLDFVFQKAVMPDRFRIVPGLSKTEKA